MPINVPDNLSAIEIFKNKNIFTKKALIFDMDGTIVDNIPYHNRARLFFLEKYGIKFHPSETEVILNLSTKVIVRNYFGNNLSSQEIKALDGEKQLIYRNLYKGNIKEIDGFKQLLVTAKDKGLKIALSTMGCYENIDLVLNSLKVNSYFDVIVSGKEITNGKPHPEIYTRTLSLLNINPEEAIVFEDTQSGVLSARQTGIEVIGVCTTHSQAEFSTWGTANAVLNYTNYHTNLSRIHETLQYK